MKIQSLREASLLLVRYQVLDEERESVLVKSGDDYFALMPAPHPKGGGALYTALVQLKKDDPLRRALIGEEVVEAPELDPITAANKLPKMRRVSTLSGFPEVT